MIYDQDTKVGEFLKEIGIPCDLCQEVMCDGFCAENLSQNGD